MTTMTWSPSKSARWRLCPRQFLLQHVLNVEPAQYEATHLQRGRVMHAGMEAAFAALTNNRHRDAATMAVFQADAQHAMTSHPDAQDLRTSELADCIGVVSRQLAEFPVLPAAAIIGVEHPFRFDYRGVPLRGVLDLAIRTGPASLRVVDWKSGGIADRAKSMEGDVALTVYSIAAARAWPWARVIEVGLHSLKDREFRFLRVTADMQNLVMARLGRDFFDFQSALAQLTPLALEDTFPTRTGEHCPDCVFRSYCPRFVGSAPPVRAGVDVSAERDRIRLRIAQSGMIDSNPPEETVA